MGEKKDTNKTYHKYHEMTQEVKSLCRELGVKDIKEVKNLINTILAEKDELQRNLNGAVDIEFLLENHIDKKQLYNYLKLNPQASVWFYNKDELKPFIQNLADPAFPAFIPELPEILKEKFGYENEKHDINKLRNEKIILTSEVSGLKEEVEELEQQVNDLNNKQITSKKEYEEISGKLLSLSSKEAIDLVNNTYEMIKKKEKDVDMSGAYLTRIEFTNLQKNIARIIEIMNTDLKKQIDEENKQLVEDIQRSNQQLKGRDNIRNIKIAYEGFSRIWDVIVNSAGTAIPKRTDLDKVQNALLSLVEFAENSEKEKKGLFRR